MHHHVLGLVFVSLAYGCIKNLDPEYDPKADFKPDGIIDISDVGTCAYHLLWQKKYP